jgi:hypothetical protein
MARGEGFWGIGLTSSVKKRGRVANMARIRGEKRRDRPLFNQTKGELEVENRQYLPAYFGKFDVCRRDIGILHDANLPCGPRSDFRFLSLLMSGAWVVQQRTGNFGWVDTIWTFSRGLVGSFRRSLPYRTQIRSANIIEAEAAKRGVNNLRVITCDMNRFDIERCFDCDAQMAAR